MYYHFYGLDQIIPQIVYQLQFKIQIFLLFTRSHVYDDFSPASFDAKHWNMAESSMVNFLITRELSSRTAYLE